jgi:hypothetical protein
LDLMRGMVWWGRNRWGKGERERERCGIGDEREVGWWRIDILRVCAGNWGICSVGWFRSNLSIEFDANELICGQYCFRRVRWTHEEHLFLFASLVHFLNDDRKNKLFELPRVSFRSVGSVAVSLLAIQKYGSFWHPFKKLPCDPQMNRSGSFLLIEFKVWTQGHVRLSDSPDKQWQWFGIRRNEFWSELFFESNPKSLKF